MLNREKICNEIPYKLSFMDDSWDRALLGYAESGGRGRYVLPCYGYQAMKAILKAKGYDGIDSYVALQLMFREMPQEVPLILTKVSRVPLWKEAADKKFMRWEALDKAVLGIGRLKYTTTGLVYSKPLCVNILASTSKSGTNKLVTAINKLEEELIPVEAPNYTPWYLTPVK